MKIRPYARVIAVVVVVVVIGISQEFNVDTHLTSRSEERHYQQPIEPVVLHTSQVFEGSQLGEWVAQERVAVFGQPDGKTIYTLDSGERVVAIDSYVWAVPREAIVTGVYESDQRSGIQIGSRIQVLHPIGEGAVMVRLNGKFIEGSLDLSFDFLDGGSLEWTWWVKIRTKTGLEGWLRDPQGKKFVGMDRYE